MPNHQCIRCGYVTNKICNYKSHLTKKKPCKTTYSDVDRSSILAALNTLDRKNACKALAAVSTVLTKADVDGIEDKESYIIKMHDDNAKLKCENLKLKHENAELMTKLKQLHDGGANITNNNINISININNYGAENINYVTDDFVLNAIQKAHPVPLLLKHIHFNPDHPENHNVRLPNKNGKYVLVRRNGEWMHENRREKLTNMVSSCRNRFIDDFSHVLSSLSTGQKQKFEEVSNVDDDSSAMSKALSKLEIIMLNSRR